MANAGIEWDFANPVPVLLPNTDPFELFAVAPKTGVLGFWLAEAPNEGAAEPKAGVWLVAPKAGVWLVEPKAGVWLVEPKAGVWLVAPNAGVWPVVPKAGVWLVPNVDACVVGAPENYILNTSLQKNVSNLNYLSVSGFFPEQTH